MAVLPWSCPEHPASPQGSVVPRTNPPPLMKHFFTCCLVLVSRFLKASLCTCTCGNEQRWWGGTGRPYHEGRERWLLQCDWFVQAGGEEDGGDIPGISGSVDLSFCPKFPSQTRSPGLGQMVLSLYWCPGNSCNCQECVQSLCELILGPCVY